jgi:hypothetical protein
MVHHPKVTIRGTKPPMWRRVAVLDNATLADVQSVIQAAFGWWDYHLHEFEIDGVRYGTADGEGWGEPPKKSMKHASPRSHRPAAASSTRTTLVTTGGTSSKSRRSSAPNPGCLTQPASAARLSARGLRWRVVRLPEPAEEAIERRPGVGVRAVHGRVQSVKTFRGGNGEGGTGALLSPT